MQKMTRTFLRTEETMRKYKEITDYREKNGIKVDCFFDWKKALVKEFDNWVIIENDFPYDAVATVHHMISTKRETPFDWKLLNEQEREELQKLREGYIQENYDVVYENLPKGQTIPGHFHLHLLVLKREEM